MPDTNIIYNILNNDGPTMEMLDYIVTNGGILCIAEKTVEELNIATDRDVKKENNLSFQRTQEIAMSISKAEANYSIIFGLESVFPTPFSLDVDNRIEYVSAVRKQSRLPWADAYILSTAKCHGIPYIWTNDKDFAYLKDNNFAIITNKGTKDNFIKSGMVHHTFIGFK